MKARLLAITAVTALVLPILPGRVSAQEVQKSPSVQDSTSAVQAALDTTKNVVAAAEEAVVAVADTLKEKAEAAVVAAADTVKAEAEKAVVAAVDTVKAEADRVVAAADSTAAPVLQDAAETAAAAQTALAAAQEAEKAATEVSQKAAKKSKENKSKSDNKQQEADTQVAAAQPAEAQPANTQASADAAVIMAAAQLLAQANANQAAATTAQPAPNAVAADDATLAAAAAKAADLARAQEKEAAMKQEADNARLRAAEAEEHRRELKKAEREGRRTVKGRSYKFFNHVGVGLVSGLDGVGVDVAVPIYGHLQLRGGYSFIPKQIKVQKTFDLGTFEVNGSDRDFNDVSIKLQPDMSLAKAFLDIYPTRWTAFHLTVGAYYGISSPNFVKLSADVSNILLPGEYASVYVQIDDQDRPGEYARASTDENGIAHIAVRSKQVIRPYLGIGFGRCANLKHRVSVNFELGVQYIKGVGIEVGDYTGEEPVYKYLTSGMTDGKDTVDNPLTGKKMRIIDTLGEDLNLWPVMRFGINVRLF